MLILETRSLSIKGISQIYRFCSLNIVKYEGAEKALACSGEKEVLLRSRSTLLYRVINFNLI